MSRSLKKPLHVYEKLLKKVKKAEGKSPIKTWARNSVVTPEMIGSILLIHNGKEFKKRVIATEDVGHKLGEFSPTRQSGKHGKAGTR